MDNSDIRALIERLRKHRFYLNTAYQDQWQMSEDMRDAADALSLLLDVKLAAEQIDIWLRGEDLYEGSWINYPQKPEQSPALFNRKALKAVEDA